MFNRFLLFVAALCLTVAPGFAQTNPPGSNCFQVINGVGVYRPCFTGSSETVTFSATPTFSILTAQSEITLTANITSFTLATGNAGQVKTLTFCQNGTGNFTVAAPANVHGFSTVGATASKCSVQTFSFSALQNAWLATGAASINQ